MNDALRQLEALLAGTGVEAPRFPPSSRYASTPVTTLVRPDGGMIAHLRRRFVPEPDRFAVLREHTVVGGERLDLLAAQHLGDPELFWRLCDANGALRPRELEAVGRRLRITLPEGIPGGSDA